MPSMIAIVHSIYSQSVHAPASHAGLMDNEAERYCMFALLDKRNSDQRMPNLDVKLHQLTLNYVDMD